MPEAPGSASFCDQLCARRWSSLSLLAVALLVAPVGYLAGRSGSRGGGTDAAAVPPPGALSSPRLLSLAQPALDTSPSPPSQASDHPFESAIFSLPAWEQRWDQLTREVDSPARSDRLAAALQELGAQDHERALAIALAQPELTLREQLLQASLRGWGSAAPAAAADWAMQRDEASRPAAIEAVLTGAARQPAVAAQLARQLCRQDAAFATGYGHALISALAAQGSFAAAAGFAAGAAGEDRSTWVNSAYFQWAQYQPEQALTGINAIPDPAARKDALAGVMAGWAKVNPARATAYAMQIPPGEARAGALAEALPEWVRSDPAAAAQWMNSAGAHPDFDAGAAAVANLSSLVAEEPQTAIVWAEHISDPALRLSTLRSVTEQWAQSNRPAATSYVANSPALSTTQRHEILESLSTAP